MKKHLVERMLEFVALPLALYALLVLLTACAWSVPADPGLNARRRAEPYPPSRTETAWAVDRADGGRLDPAARQLYVSHCGRCHEPWPTTHLSARQWPRFVRKYAPRAGLFGADRDRVLRWLQANAR